MSFIKCNNLIFEYTQYDYDNDKNYTYRAIDDISFEIQKGDFIAVLGHNGSGKSTLAKHLNALLTPTKGTLWIKGLDTSVEDNTWDIRRSAGMVFQNPDNQLIATVVEEDVAFGPENLGIEPEEIRKNVDMALESVGMNEFRESAPNLLSGGQKQRIAIAGILAMKPDCIVLDEPTAMLDPIGRQEVIKTIRRLNKEENITIILITHYMEEAVLADRVIVMNSGRIVMDDTPKIVFSQVERLKELHLDVPQVTELAGLLNKDGFNIRKDVLSIEEMINEIEKNGIDIEKIPSLNKFEYDVSSHPSIIEVRNLTHIYGNETAFERVALKDVSFTIKKGEFIGLIGHTGSGKSTLIQHLNALVKPDSGDVLLNGRSVFADKESLKSIRQSVGLVFQYPEHQLFETTVEKDIAFGPKNMGLSDTEIKERVLDSLRLVGLSEDYLQKSPFELSGGQKRRVAIAGVLAMKPEVLVLDEPTAGLDPYAKNALLKNISLMHESLGITIILVSHSMEDISTIAQRILVMNKGEVEFFDVPDKVFENAEGLNKIGLNTPQISQLMLALNKRGIPLAKNIYSVSDAHYLLSSSLKKN